ncbi:alpha/beta hydrolase [Saccharopolyspora sp. K220]|uniref:alpha/beta hydrolase n=1 Tax=Saccharopolyspora soli TaxID=2926618 RepID=UPI001F596393|nr:alpha/beta hydrolase [Saccharopolyspora soli]MCI2415824.1 alpha/beta hydrolase [Saccharopolyspora soli]
MSFLSWPPAARLAATAFQSLAHLAKTGGQVRFPEIPGRTRSVRIPTGHGPVPATVYLPPDGTESPPAAHVNFHGGGFVIRNPEQDDPLCRYLAARAGVAVINVDYPVAPQHPFPMPPKACYEVVRWICEHGTDLGVDRCRVSVGGQSAGGALAAAVARQARDLGGPDISLQVLHYPPLDLATSGKDKLRARTRSERPFLKPWMAEIFDNAYTPEKAQRTDPLVSPALGENDRDLTGVAPALVITAELDLLRDEGVRYAESLRRDGVLREHRDIRGADHGYDLLGGADELVREMYDLIASHVIAASAKSSDP